MSFPAQLCVCLCVCSFQLSPRFVVAVKCCPPGEILAVAPFCLSPARAAFFVWVFFFFFLCQGHQDQQRQWISLPPLSVHCQHHQRCDTPTSFASARLSRCTSESSLRKSERCVQTLLRFLLLLLSFSLSLSISLSHRHPPLPSPSSAQVKALAVWR